MFRNNKSKISPLTCPLSTNSIATISRTSLDDWEVIQEEDYRFKIILLGDANVGKTSLMTQFTQKTFPESPLTTIAFEHFKEDFLIEGNLIRVTFWDTAGMERYHSLGGKYYQGVNGIILVYDITNRQSFLNVKNWIKEMHGFNIADNVVCILIGNKSDCVKERQVTNLEAKQFTSEYPEIYWTFETTAKDYTSFEEPLIKLVTQIGKQVGGIFDQRKTSFSLFGAFRKRDTLEMRREQENEMRRRYKIKTRTSSFSLGNPVKNWWSKWAKC